MEFFQSQGVSIAYVDLRADEGANDPVILVHGFASNHLVNWVNTSWTRTLNRAGFRVIALDNRGHGESAKLYDPELYQIGTMAGDVRALMDHLHIERADMMGYSMGARIATFLALKSPERVRSLLLGGLGIRLIEGGGLPSGIAEAMEANPLLDTAAPAPDEPERGEIAGPAGEDATESRDKTEEWRGLWCDGGDHARWLRESEDEVRRGDRARAAQDGGDLIWPTSEPDESVDAVRNLFCCLRLAVTMRHQVIAELRGTALH